MMTTKEHLKQALELIREKEHWTQFTNARDKNKIAVSALDETAYCFCAVGALSRIISIYLFDHQVFAEAVFMLEQQVGKSSRYDIVSDFNDNSTHEAVVKLYEDTIASMTD